MKVRILIALVYNNNGISTWCFEAARGLQKAGCEVWLAYQDPAVIPIDLLHCSVKYIPDNKNRSVRKKIIERIQWYGQLIMPVQPEAHVVPDCLELLLQKGIIPNNILVSQTDFVSPHTNIPQWVAGRAWPVTFAGYLSKITLSSSLPWLSRLHDFVYWYKMDHKGYRIAKGVLAVTLQLTSDLKKLGINAQCVYPGSGSAINSISKRNGQKIRFITAALHLEDKRKNISWLLTILATIQKQNGLFELTLVGEYTERFKEATLAEIPQACFVGRLSRAELMEEMLVSDVFIFSSVQENWGYVLVEAMAHGLAVMAPNQMPYVEIIGRADYLFDLNNRTECLQKIQRLLLDSRQVLDDKAWFYIRYKSLFSSEAFGHSILTALSDNSNLILNTASIDGQG